MSKDQAIGGAIFIVCLLVAVCYIVTLFVPSIPGQIMVDLGLYDTLAIAEESILFWIVAIPVFIAFIAVLFIGAWIGWTMATTPPPKPIEEITSEMEDVKASE